MLWSRVICFYVPNAAKATSCAPAIHHAFPVAITKRCPACPLAASLFRGRDTAGVKQLKPSRVLACCQDLHQCACSPTVLAMHVRLLSGGCWTTFSDPAFHSPTVITRCTGYAARCSRCFRFFCSLVRREQPAAPPTLSLRQLQLAPSTPATSATLCASEQDATASAPAIQHAFPDTVTTRSPTCPPASMMFRGSVKLRVKQLAPSRVLRAVGR